MVASLSASQRSPHELILDGSFLTSTADPDQQLITLTAEPGTPSHDCLAWRQDSEAS